MNLMNFWLIRSEMKNIVMKQKKETFVPSIYKLPTRYRMHLTNKMEQDMYELLKHNKSKR